MLDKFLRDQIEENRQMTQLILDDTALCAKLQSCCQGCLETYQQGGKILIAGNGGSAADAQHIAGELVSRFFFDRPALAAIALTTDTSILTAIGNDYGYEALFARQIEAHGQPGDVFLAISTSGNSPNILSGIQTAKKLGLKCYGLTGSQGGKMQAICDLLLSMPSDITPRIQEGHILMGHLICAFIERGMFAAEKPE